MRYDALVSGLAVTLAAITVVFAVLGVVYSPPVLFVAATFAAATYFVYYHASGRLADRVYRRVERQAAKNAAGARGRGGRSPGRRGDAGGPGRADGGGRGQRGGFGAGPREEWVPPRDGASARQAAGGQQGGGTRGARHRSRGGQQQRQRQRQQRRQRRRRPGERPPSAGGPTPAEAYRRLGLEPGADEADVKAAYREKVKETHPDTDGGDEEAFKEVTAAYERLTD